MRSAEQSVEISLPFVVCTAMAELWTKGEGVEVSVDVGTEKVALVGAAKIGFERDRVIQIRGG